MNAVRLRKLLASLEGEDYPASPQRVYRQIRSATSGGQLEVPHVDLDGDIGGYEKVKRRLKCEILDVLALKDRRTEADEIRRLEGLIPKGMIFWGPPGTGKTLFAKAMATAMGGGNHRRLRTRAQESLGGRERREPAADLPSREAVGPGDHRL